MIPSWLGHPWWLMLLLALPVVGLGRALAGRRRQCALRQMGATPSRERWFTMQSGLRFLRSCLHGAMLLCLVLGIAGPRWGRVWGQSGSTGRDVVVVLDLSRSMYARDVQPNRLGRAKDAVHDLLSDSIESTGGYRVGLVVFAARAKVLCPLTHDTGHFREVLQRIDLEKPPADLLPTSADESGTRIGQGLLTAVALHEPQYEGSQDILLFSDGDDPGADSASERALGVNAARDRRIPVHAIGIGDPEHDIDVPFDYGTQNLTRLREGPLKDIARPTAGTYVPIQPGRTANMGRLFEDHMTQNLRLREQDAVPVFQERYGWFFAAALALIAGDLLFGVGWRNLAGAFVRRMRLRSPGIQAEPTNRARWAALGIAASVLIFLGAAQVAEELALILEGNEAFARRDYEEADRLYAQAEQDAIEPGLVAYNRAAVAYRLGRYSAAESFYRQALSDAEGSRRLHALMGLADSLVRQDLGTGPLREAGRCYRACLSEFPSALEQEPELRDDIANNLDLAKLLFLRAEAAEKVRGQPQPPEPRNSEHSTRPDNKSDGREQEPQEPQGSGTRPDSKRGAGRVPAQQNKQPILTDEQVGGVGRLPPVPDKDELVPLTPEVAAAHLKAAGDRLMRQMRSLEKSAGDPVGALDR